MAPKKKIEESRELTCPVVERGMIEACLIGSTPILLNRISEKAWRELLFPHGRKSTVERKVHLKHHPLEEYRESPYTDKAPDGPTVLQIPSVAIKKAMASVPQDLPGMDVTMAQLSRLMFTYDERIPLYGIPCLHMGIVKQAGISRAPDVRTRACVRQWACKVKITYIKPVLRQEVVTRLLATAGYMKGLCDWRPGKGSGSYGCFEVVAEDDPRFQHIVATGGRAAQMAAMETPEAYDDETGRMLTWFNLELNRRGFVEGGNGKSEQEFAELAGALEEVEEDESEAEVLS